MAAQDIDMAGHVLQMTRIRHQVEKRIGGFLGALGVSGHFHGMDVHVENARVLPSAFDALQGVFKHGDRFQRVGALCRPAGLVPQLPGRAVQQRLGEQRRDLQMTAIPGMNAAHGNGIGVVPAVEIVATAKRITGQKRLA